MTAIEMQLTFQQKLNNHLDFKYNIPTIDINKFLNLSQLKLCRELYEAKLYNKLSNIIVTEILTGESLTAEDKTYLADLTNLSSTFLYYIRSRVKISRTDPTITNEWITTERIFNQESLYRLLKSPFNTPWFKQPRVYLEKDANSSLLIAVDSYTEMTAPYTGAVEITYVKEPIEIDIDNEVNTELNLELHTTIIDYAVQEAVRSLNLIDGAQKQETKE